ncbi:MAG: nucleotide exchange factor GrpE [Actinomycetota bacterium]|nr:nucleotide exchange factor GrpE [Actinomycetota bacterium]
MTSDDPVARRPQAAGGSPPSGAPESEAADQAQAAPPAPGDELESVDDAPRPSESDEAGATGDDGDLEAARMERDEYLDLAQRTRAEFDNYRKRVAKDSAAALERGKVNLAKELIPVIDNLELAMAAEDGSSDPAALAKGVALVHAELRSALDRVGLHAYDPAGEQFDPSWHEAISTRPQEGAAPGTVVETIAPGYRLDGQLLRAARVVVSE